MTMRAALFGEYPIPDDTFHLAHAIYPGGNRLMQIRDHFGMLFDNQQFHTLFFHTGQPAVAPARLALVTILQFISREWDNLLRIFVSLARKTTTQSVLVSKLSATKRRNRTLQALWEYDHLVASQYLLDYVDSETVRQHVQRALNRGEQYHQLKRALTQGNAGKLRFSSDEEQELWDACSRLLVNVILYYKGFSHNTGKIRNRINKSKNSLKT